MSRFLIDTSCMVAFLCTWHEHNHRAVREIERRVDGGEVLVVAAPALVETYAVLTRLPPPYRISPADSRALLQANFVTDALEVAALDQQGYRELLNGAPEREIAGGIVYDAVILACAVSAKVDALLTFNERQFRLLSGSRVEIIVPP